MSAKTKTAEPRISDHDRAKLARAMRRERSAQDRRTREQRGGK